MFLFNASPKMEAIDLFVKLKFVVLECNYAPNILGALECNYAPKFKSLGPKKNNSI